jgi:hypothetical protein
MYKECSGDRGRKHSTIKSRISEIVGTLLGNLSNYCCHFHAAAAKRLRKFFAGFGNLRVELLWRLALVVELRPLYLGWARRRPY